MTQTFAPQVGVLSAGSIYRIESRDSSGNLLAVLPYYNAQINLTLNSINKLRLQVPMDEPNVRPETIDTGIYLWVWRFDQLLFQGIIWNIHINSGDRALNIVCEDVFSVFNWRYIFDEVTYNGAAWDIAYDLIQYSQALSGGDLGITHNHTDTGRKPYYPFDPNYVPPGSTTYKVEEPPSQNSLMKIIMDTLTKQTGGFEFRIDQNNVFQTYYPSMGTDTNRTLTFGADVSNYSIQRFHSSLLNDGWFKAYDEGERAVARVQDTSSINTYGRFQKVISLPDAPPTPEACKQGGYDWIASRKDRMVVPQITLRTIEETNEAIAPIGLGDTFNILIEDGYVEFFDRMRCIGIGLSIGSETQETVVIYMNDLRGQGV